MPDSRSGPVTLTVNGSTVAVPSGATVAVAVVMAGQACRMSVSGEARGPLCGMGICFECRASINGTPHCRSCQILLRTGHGSGGPTGNEFEATLFDVLVIGGGPAGMAAAVRAAECGGRVGMVDDNPTCGGQIWRGASEGRDGARWTERLETADITKLYGKRVFHAPEAGVLLAEGTDDLSELRYTNLILATGAAANGFCRFPGWTLQNVMGAGGLQAMVKAGLPIQGKRIIIAGTGPLLLAVAAYLRKQGAEIPTVCEQASWSRLARFTARLVGYPGKIVQGLAVEEGTGGRGIRRE